jgi:hypothetical protein
MAKYKMVGNNRIELKGEELSAFEQMQTDAHNDFLLQKQKWTENTNKKASGKQKLKDLGLDDEEIQALMGS